MADTPGYVQFERKSYAAGEKAVAQPFVKRTINGVDEIWQPFKSTRDGKTVVNCRQTVDQARDMHDALGAILDAAQPVPAPPLPPAPASPWAVELPTATPIFDGLASGARDGFPSDPFPFAGVQQWGSSGREDASKANVKRITTGSPFGMPFYRWTVNGGERAEAYTPQILREGIRTLMVGAVYIPLALNPNGFGSLERAVLQFGHPGAQAPPVILKIVTNPGWQQRGLFITSDALIADEKSMYGRVFWWTALTDWSRGLDGRFQFWVGKQQFLDRNGPNLLSATASNKEGNYGDSPGCVVESIGHRVWIV